MRDAGAEITFSATSPPIPGSRSATSPAPTRRRCRVTSWGRPAWATTRATSVCDPWQRLHDVDNVLVHRLVGVPDVDRLRPDAHDRRARHPRRRGRWPASTRCAQPARPAPERRPPIVRFGTYHVFQCPPGQDPARVVQEELARAELAEALGYDDVWVPEQHFSPYCLAGDALLLAGHIAARTKRVQIGTAVVNLTFTHRCASRSASRCSTT